MEFGKAIKELPNNHTTMLNEYNRLKAQLAILKDVVEEYGENRSLGNVIQNIEAKIKWHEKHQSND